MCSYGSTPDEAQDQVTPAPADQPPERSWGRLRLGLITAGCCFLVLAAVAVILSVSGGARIGGPWILKSALPWTLNFSWSGGGEEPDLAAAIAAIDNLSCHSAAEQAPSDMTREAALKAVEASKARASRAPGSRRLARDLASSYLSLASAAHRRHAELLGRDPDGHEFDDRTREAARQSLQEARRAAAGALEITRGLVKAEPTNPAHKRDLADAFRQVGEVAEDQQDLAAAARAYAQARKLYQEQQAAAPGDVAIKRTLVELLKKVASVAEARDDPDKPLATKRQVIRLYRILLGGCPEDSAIQHDLARAYFNLGNMYFDRSERALIFAQSEVENAHRHFLKALEAMKPLVAADPGAANESGDLYVVFTSSIYRRLGKLARTPARKAEAHEGLLAAHNILESLVSANPTNGNYIGNLATSSDNLGKMALARGDRKGAMAAFHRSVELNSSLVAADDTSSTYKRMLLNSNLQVIRLALEQGDAATARKHLSQALKLVKVLDTMGLIPDALLKRQRQEVLMLAKKHLS